MDKHVPIVAGTILDHYMPDRPYTLQEIGQFADAIAHADVSWQMSNGERAQRCMVWAKLGRVRYEFVEQRDGYYLKKTMVNAWAVSQQEPQP